MTVPRQVAIAPEIPGAIVQSWYMNGDGDGTMYVYDKPNNLSLPDYHRLDLGINFRKITKKGHERIWNISVYNATCRMNPFFAKVK